MRSAEFRNNAGRVVHFPLLLTLALFALPGCFSERAYPIAGGDFRPVVLSSMESIPPDDTRAWIVRVQPQLAPLLPPDPRSTLLTEDLVGPDGCAVDVLKHFERTPDSLHTLFGNFYGLLHTAQAAGANSSPEYGPPPWPGFEDVWIPVGGVTPSDPDSTPLELSGRLGFARQDERIVFADCIVLIPGLIGDNSVVRSRDIAIALRQAGFHVLALEQRGAGRTNIRFPDVAYNFGVFEAGDLLAVSEWLEDQPAIRRTGLIGYCWGANTALLTAWEDGRAADDPLANPRLRPFLRPRAPRAHFEVGILAFSPTLSFEHIVETLDERRWTTTENPVLKVLQDEIEDRMRRERYPEISGSLRRLIEFEFARSPLNYPQAVADSLDYLRFLPFKGKSAGDKLEHARMPVLIVHAQNDPLTSAQTVADLFVGLKNRRVAGMVLPGGGHVGFAPYAKSYFYSLLLNFFDPHYGAAAMTEAPGERTVD